MLGSMFYSFLIIFFNAFVNVPNASLGNLNESAYVISLLTTYIGKLLFYLISLLID